MITIIAEKEFKDYIKSRRFLLIFGFLLLISIVSIWQGYNIYQSKLESYIAGKSPFQPSIFDVFRQMENFLGLIGAIFALSLGFDAITKEREMGTLKVLMSHPVYKDQVILGKFLGGALALGLAMVVMTLTSFGALLVMGLQIDGESLIRIILFMFFTYLYLLLFLGIGMAFSALSKSSSNALMYSLILFLVLMIVFPTIAPLLGSHFAGEAPEPPKVSREENPHAWELYIKNYIEWQEKRYGIETKINSLSPYYNFQQLGSYILNPYKSTKFSPQIVNKIMNNPQLVRALRNRGIIPQIELEKYSIGQSLSFALPHIILLIAPLIISFVVAYVIFMRSDVR
ncbi:ABC transporter permease [Thermococcus sp. M39]|uniref:ABC transporter permease subunit n=1 Tax=unclassified Thermococcus TaxID=2627626 RepID=UPI00143B041B|nr:MULTISPECIES: ABC transporter permease subunit [unclassified Thermococcus]NJE07334.1 ABC transporter permease [Thermococcus sp. M39]NJE12535.1 ABC transporter permease [Thermococcus sp. LS2]